MAISIDKTSRRAFILFTIAAMLLGLIFSRAMLSISMILFLAATCIHKNFVQQLKQFVSNPFLLGLAVLFLLPFVSGLWSDNKYEWANRIRIKFPLLLLPIAFAGNWQLTKKQWRSVAYFFLILIFAGCCWSLWQYMSDNKFVEEGYLKAKLIATPLENDHVRFSWIVCVAVICSIILIKEITERKIKMGLGFFAIFFTVYLHILSARTGLISLYIFFLLYFFYLIFSLKKRKWIIVLCLSVVSMPIAAWYLLPTFQNRIKYIIYDFSYLQKEAYLPGANDGNRMFSLKAGWNILNQHPFGVGTGDVFDKTKEWYSIHIPQMLDTDKFYPSSEWLVYGGAAGWAGVFLFTIIMLLPLFQKKREELFFWRSLNIIAAFSFMFDIGLEVQFGVFTYTFIILWWWKWLQNKHRV